MCIACTEFLKGSLKWDEFQRALSETTRDDPEHLAEVNRALGENSPKGPASDQDLRQKLRDKLKAK